MNEPRPADLEARMSRLEDAVDQLQQAVRRIEVAVAPAASPPVAAVATAEPAPLATAAAEARPLPLSEPVPPAAAAAGAPASGEDAGGPLAWLPGVQPVLNGEFWLSKVGIGLLLLGVAFLFKYSIEQGWITPVVRLAAGAAVGTALTAWGLRIHGEQRSLSRVLLGGGIAAFYMVGFAASQLYGLLPNSAALVYMAAVTSAAFLLSLREDEPVLTIVGTLGGVGTPFLLYPRTGSLGWLAAYVAFIALWNGVVYARRRWDSALLTAGIGSWTALVSGLVVSERAGPPPLDARWALQGALVLVWAVLGVLPAALYLLRAAPGGAADDGEADDREILAPAALAFVSPLVAAVFTSAVWELTARQWGAGTAVLGLAYLAAALWARERRGEMAAVLGLAGAVLLTVGTGIGAEGEARIVLLAAEAAGLHLLSRRGLGRGSAGWAHLVFGVLGIAFLARLGGFNPLAAVFAPDGGTAGEALPAARRLADLAVAGALLAASLGARDRTGRILRAAALAALFLWGWRELAVLPHGVALATVAWALGGVGLLALAARGEGEAAPVAHAVFAVLAALLLRHLAEADPLAVLGRAAERPGVTPVFNARGLADLAVIACAFAASRLLPARERLVYSLAVHAAVMQWIWREFSGLPGGEGIVSALWGVYGVALLVVATLRGWATLQSVAKLTLLFLVAKMFLVDLRALEALWRVLLFSGLGGLFLVLSYYVGRRRQLEERHGHG
ncbi:MAG TPA: DUF2339 domain-containing protein [Longimicrobiaceae bacterium]|jgi:hypothetical protein